MLLKHALNLKLSKVRIQSFSNITFYEGCLKSILKNMRKPGIEPGAQRWQRWILPLNHLRLKLISPRIELGTFCVLSRCHNQLDHETNY
ncbi:unnamed protein product [Debaryomyces tyrocola]|nr:unnamed protein product [Debaryomyces tyrocola]